TSEGKDLELRKPKLSKYGDLFILWVLPELGEKAKRYKIKESGKFFWKLKPGNYVIASYAWNPDAGGSFLGDFFGGGRSDFFSGDRLWAKFSVSEDHEATYIGTLVIRDTSELTSQKYIEDESESAPDWLLEANPKRSGSVATSLMELEEQPWADRGIPICSNDWEITCGKRNGVNPVTPRIKRMTLFPSVDSSHPTLEWEPLTNNPDITYDIVIFEAIKLKKGYGYERGRAVEYEEGLSQPSYEIRNSLVPDKRYFWSVRLRNKDAVSIWSTYVSYYSSLLSGKTITKFNEFFGVRYRKSGK
ncbi:MAG: hypothetical protein IH901_06400, partial [Proteobacteria bacterium]|nr:hypothetical protein [Pseudomonadota bacterium]